jgi:hypothetical protein
MTTLGIQRNHGRVATRPAPEKATARRFLIACGIAAGLYYAALNVFVAMSWKGYSAVSQTVSELSAIGAPTRALWVRLSPVHSLLVIAFGLGVWMSAGRTRSRRVAGGALVASAVLGLFWPPMHLRGATPTTTDALHIAFTVVWLVFTLITIGFGAASLGKRFRRYSAVTLAIFAGFGVLTGLEAPNIARNLPTPWIGLWERINIGVFILWTLVFAAALLAGGTRSRGEPAMPRAGRTPDPSPGERDVAGRD